MSKVFIALQERTRLINSMKVLTVAIPCYNSSEYMEHAIESLLVGKEDIEILVVNDGSTDETADIAKRYEEKYPDIVRLINKPNGGHGDAVNTGIKNASGVYFKVVDSDDWVNSEVLLKIIKFLKKMIENKTDLDMLITNYVYDKVGEKKKKVVGYKSCLPVNKIFGWEDIGHFKKSQNILMHSVIYRSEVLMKCGLELPKHTFYVDNIFVFQPLPYIKSIYYMDESFYHYFIGREDQSVNEKVMMGRIDQQIRVNKLMIDYYDSNKGSEKCKKYMIKYLDMITIVSSVYLMKIGTKESLEKKDDLWDYLKQNKNEAYKKMRHCFIGFVLNQNNCLAIGLTKAVYTVSRKIFKFN